MEVIESNTSGKVTPYGVLYKNANESEQVYDGKHFPPYIWKESMATLELKAKGKWIYLSSFFWYWNWKDIDETWSAIFTRLWTMYW